MLDESEYKEMKERLPVVKRLFQTRHLNQCASFCERLLTQSNEQIHPVHNAYLNFYVALSHDTMAREAGMRNRSVELELAERHYLAAISDLTPPGTQKRETILDVHSPTSSESESDIPRRRASDAASLNSDHSASTTATSSSEEDQGTAGYKPARKKSVAFAPTSLFSGYEDATAISFKAAPRRPSPINTRSMRPAASYHEPALSTDLSSFINMIKSHLAGVRELKSAPIPSTHRYSFSRPRSSTPRSRPVSSMYEEAGMEKVRWQRKSMNFRPRFDPTSVQKLCAEALDEL